MADLPRVSDVYVSVDAGVQWTCGNVLADLDKRCETCNGSGMFMLHGASHDCIVCDGKGRLLTENGKRLLSFLQEWYRPEHKE